MSNYKGMAMAADDTTQQEKRQALFNRGMALLVLGVLALVFGWVMVTSDDMFAGGLVGMLLGLGLLAGGTTVLSKR